MNIQISFTQDGTALCLWTEAVPLHELGRLEIHRVTNIEFNPSAQVWEVRLASKPGVVAFSHSSRDTCLEWEREAINALL